MDGCVIVKKKTFLGFLYNHTATHVTMLDDNVKKRWQFLAVDDDDVIEKFSEWMQTIHQLG